MSDKGSREKRLRRALPAFGRLAAEYGLRAE